MNIMKCTSNRVWAAATALVVGLMAAGPDRALGTLLQDGLISYWPLNDGSGMTATDLNPAGSAVDNGTLRNSPTWLTGAAGKFNAGLQFNGVDQDVLLSTGGDMDFGGSAVTLSAWVKLDQLPSQIAGSFSGILDSAQDNFILYLDKGQNELRFKATNSSNISTLAAQHPGVRAPLLNTSDWLHVMGVFDGVQGRAMIYFNGQLVDITTQASNTSLTLAGSTVRAGQIGAFGSQPAATDPFAPGSLFQGKISDFAMWNRALGGAEAQYLYNGGVGNAVGAANPDIAPLPPLTPVLPTAQPVIYYKFDGNLNNSGTGGSTYNAVLHDVAGRNDNLFVTDTSVATFGQGLDLRENPVSTSSITDPGDYLSVDYTLTDSGTISARFTAVSLQNFVTLWSNSSHENDWEAWVYGDGRIAGRADRATPIVASSIFLQPDPTAPQHIAMTWQRDMADPNFVTMRLYINGEWLDERRGAWRDPGTTFFIAGGSGPPNGNHLGTGVYDEFRIYNSALNDAEVLYLSQNAPDVTFQPGDFNLDGKINAADYVLWRSDPDSYGGPTGYNTWRANFGASGAGVGSGGFADAVPEPTIVSMIVIGLAALVGIARPARIHSLERNAP
jgi:hypothetical protein